MSNLNKNNILIAKGDSDATSHYCQGEDKFCLTPVVLPNADSIEPSNQSILPLSKKLSKLGRKMTRCCLNSKAHHLSR